MVKQYLRSTRSYAYTKGFATPPARQGGNPVPPPPRRPRAAIEDSDEESGSEGEFAADKQGENSDVEVIE